MPDSTNHIYNHGTPLPNINGPMPASSAGTAVARLSPGSFQVALYVLWKILEFQEMKRNFRLLDTVGETVSCVVAT